MNSLERIMSTLSGDKTDFQPFTMLLSLYGASLIKSDTHEYYRNPNLWFEGQQAVVDTFDPDIVISPFASALEAEAFGSEIVLMDKFAPNIKKPIITNLSEIDKLTIPDFDKSPSIQYLLKTSALLAENYKGKKAIASILLSPVDLPALLMGAEMWIDTLLFQPKEVEKMLEKTTEHFVNLGNQYLENGSTFLVVLANFCNPMMITDKIFAHLLPYLDKAFSQIKGPIVVHHGGCKLVPFIDRFAKLSNVIAFVLEHNGSFDQARQSVGDKMVLMGNFDGPNFENLSVEKAKEITLKILNNRKDDKHFIFATSNADIPYETPVETIKAVVETIRNYKKY